MDSIQDELLAKAGGAVGAEFFGGRRFGSKVGRAVSRQSRKTAGTARAVMQRDQAVALVNSLGDALSTLNGVIENRTLRSMMTSLSNATTAKTPETILRRTIRIIDRLAPYEPKQMQAKHATPADDYATIKELEEALRSSISNHLSRISRNWWKERVSDDVRQRAEDRRSQKERREPGLNRLGVTLLHFIDFADYIKIVTRKDNWRDAFKAVFRDEEILRAKLRELEDIRNDVAHSRSLTSLQRRKLQVYVSDLCTSIERDENR